MSAFVQTSHPLLGCSSRRCRNAPRCPVCILCHVCSPRSASLQVAFNECFDSDVLKCRGKEREMREKRRKAGQGEETENGRMEGKGRGGEEGEEKRKKRAGKCSQASRIALRLPGHSSVPGRPTVSDSASASPSRVHQTQKPARREG